MLAPPRDSGHGSGMSPTRHLTRCLVAGIVALLPMGGAVFTIVWLEGAIASSWSGKVSWYFPGLGLVLALLAVYVVGFLVTTFAGRWLWRRTDRLLEHTPLLGTLYQSLKEVLGYDSTRERFFQGVVAVRADEGWEVGFVTGEAAGPGGAVHTWVFVPSVPNPTNGKLLLVDPARLQKLDVRTADALRALVSLGKTSMGR
jgi:uncharacterized membrane protein